MLRRQAIVGVLGSLLLWTLVVPAAAQESGWRVTRLMGEAWVTRAGSPAIALTTDATVGNGEKIQTSRTGRVQLVRGAETVLVAPNSVIDISTGDGARTIVRQQAGSVSIEAEKKNVEHFEVRTPVLAAVVKGTAFTVTLRGGRATVGVARGGVDVTSFRSGQSVLVQPGQRASVPTVGRGTLAITGAGQLQSVRAGAPGVSDVKPVSVPRGGFTRPITSPTADTPVRRAAADHALRITAPIGTRIDIHKASKGLASEPRGVASESRRAGRSADGRNLSLWKQQSDAQASGDASTNSQGAMLGKAGAAGMANAASGSANSAASGVASGLSGGASGPGNAVSAAATAAGGSGGAAVSAAVRGVNGRKK